MSIPTVEESWARIDDWLARHAPVSHSLLRPPASDADIENLRLELGVSLPDDLVASLRCHDGVELWPGAPVLSTYGPLAGVADLVSSALFLRDVAGDLAGDPDDEDELAAFWRRDWLLITLGVGWQSSDGLFLSCLPGPHFGRVGRYFDEDAPSFTRWPSLRHLLADFADALEHGRTFKAEVPLAVDGVLLWEREEEPLLAEPVSPLALAAAATEPEPAPTEPDPAPLVPLADGRTAVLAFSRIVTHVPEPLPDQPDLLFAEGLTPDELLRRLGALPATLRPRTRERAREAGASPWAARRPLVRAGAAGGWAYAAQEAGAAQFVRPEVLRRVSAGTRAVALTKRGPEVRVTLTEDGIACPDASRSVMSPREGSVQLPEGMPPRYVGADPWPGSTTAYTRLLTGLADDHGIVHDPDDDADTELTSALLLPVLDDFPEYELRPVTVVRNFDLAALVERTEPRRLRTAVAAQLTRLAAETRIDTYPEVADALARIRRGEDVRVLPDDPLDLRMRTLAAETWAARRMVPPSWSRDPAPVGPEDFRAWVVRESAAQALRAFIELPVPVAAEKILHQRLSVHWRGELAADLRES